MDIREAARPSVNVELQVKIDETERKQCSGCCALWVTGWVGLGAFILSAPGQYVTQEKALVTWPARFNRYFFIPFPLMCAAFTHQYFMSKALWSKNRKQIWEINWETTIWNMGLWVGLVAGSTSFSRYFFPKWSRTYRLQQWEYYRAQRLTSTKYFPSLFGNITQDLNYIQFLWMTQIYHLMWMGVTLGLDRGLNSHYALFYRTSTYSKRCSPRWREWREIQVRKTLFPKADDGSKAGFKRWGAMFMMDPFRVGDMDKRL